MDARDLIGQRGEYIAVSRLMVFPRGALPYFQPHLLGAKCQTFDLLVELLGLGDTAYYFLAQVKTTRAGYTSDGAGLKVKVRESDVRRMARCPVPTYLLGVEENDGEVFVAAVHGRASGAIPALPARHVLDAAALPVLWAEVRAYWDGFDPARKTSVFAI
jgi:hypothetical protein